MSKEQHLSDDDILASLRGELSEAEMEQMERHMEVCSECQDRYLELSLEDDLIWPHQCYGAVTMFQFVRNERESNVTFIEDINSCERCRRVFAEVRELAIQRPMPISVAELIRRYDADLPPASDIVTGAILVDEAQKRESQTVIDVPVADVAPLRKRTKRFWTNRQRPIFAFAASLFILLSAWLILLFLPGTNPEFNPSLHVGAPSDWDGRLWCVGDGDAHSGVCRYTKKECLDIVKTSQAFPQYCTQTPEVIGDVEKVEVICSRPHLKKLEPDDLVNVWLSPASKYCDDYVAHCTVSNKGPGWVTFGVKSDSKETVLVPIQFSSVPAHPRIPEPLAVENYYLAAGTGVVLYKNTSIDFRVETRKCGVSESASLTYRMYGRRGEVVEAQNLKFPTDVYPLDGLFPLDADAGGECSPSGTTWCGKTAIKGVEYEGLLYCMPYVDKSGPVPRVKLIKAAAPCGDGKVCRLLDSGSAVCESSSKLINTVTDDKSILTRSDIFNKDSKGSCAPIGVSMCSDFLTKKTNKTPYLHGEPYSGRILCMGTKQNDGGFESNLVALPCKENEVCRMASGSKYHATCQASAP